MKVVVIKADIVAVLLLGLLKLSGMDLDYLICLKGLIGE